MIIFGLNLEELLPSYEEFAEGERHRREELKSTMEDVINTRFFGKTLIEVQTYKEEIFRYLDCHYPNESCASKIESLIRNYIRDQKQKKTVKPMVRKLMMKAKH